MTRLDKFLDAVHRFAEGLEHATRRKRKTWTRERLKAAVGVGSSIISALAMALPQVRGIAIAAGLVDAIQHSETVPKIVVRKTKDNEKNKP